MQFYSIIYYSLYITCFYNQFCSRDDYGIYKTCFYSKFYFNKIPTQTSFHYKFNKTKFSPVLYTTILSSSPTYVKLVSITCFMPAQFPYCMTKPYTCDQLPQLTVSLEENQRPQPSSDL